MPLLVAPLVAFALGTLLALGPRGPLVARDQRLALVAAGWLAALCVFPAIAYGAATEPAWSIAYVADGGRVPAILMVAAAALASACLVAGLQSGLALLRAPVERRAALSVAPLLAAAVAVTFHADRLGVVGTHLAFVRASERGLVPLTSSRFGAVLAAHDVLLVVACVLVYRVISRLGEPGPAELRPRFGRPRLGVQAAPPPPR